MRNHRQGLQLLLEFVKVGQTLLVDEVSMCRLLGVLSLQSLGMNWHLVTVLLPQSLIGLVLGHLKTVNQQISYHDTEHNTPGKQYLHQRLDCGLDGLASIQEGTSVTLWQRTHFRTSNAS